MLLPLVMTLSCSATAGQHDRMPEIPADKMTPEQKKAADEFAAGRGTPLFGPFVPLLRSPEVMLLAKAMGDYLSFKSVLPPKRNEFAILITARQWTQNYEWAVHAPIALEAGLNPEITKAVADGRPPQHVGGRGKSFTSSPPNSTQTRASATLRTSALSRNSANKAS